ncbi:MAG: hypothetical protein H5T74_02575 [Actinobacteria bacterium]|nr:hypothetical protein [Actinomycetota bacterium]
MSPRGLREHLDAESARWRSEARPEPEVGTVEPPESEPEQMNRDNAHTVRREDRLVEPPESEPEQMNL